MSDTKEDVELQCKMALLSDLKQQRLKYKKTLAVLQKRRLQCENASASDDVCGTYEQRRLEYEEALVEHVHSEYVLATVLQKLDDGEAEDLYFSAAQRGHIKAMLYIADWHQERDKNNAIEWLIRVAEADGEDTDCMFLADKKQRALASFRAGNLYRERNDPGDAKRAQEYLELAHRLGYRPEAGEPAAPPRVPTSAGGQRGRSRRRTTRVPSRSRSCRRETGARSRSRDRVRRRSV